MSRRPKDIGTWTETAVVRALQGLGFPGADRRALKGAQDVGDILVCPGVIAEVKGGAAAETASDQLIEKWLNETEREREHARADVGLLVVKRRAIGAVNAHRWWAWITLDDSCVLHINSFDVFAHAPRFTLDCATQLLRAWGFGDPTT